MHLALTAFAVRVAAHPDPDLISEARALMSAARQVAPEIPLTESDLAAGYAHLSAPRRGDTPDVTARRQHCAMLARIARPDGVEEHSAVTERLASARIARSAQGGPHAERELRELREVLESLGAALALAEPARHESPSPR